MAKNKSEYIPIPPYMQSSSQVDEEIPEGAIPAEEYNPALEEYGTTGQQSIAALENIAASGTMGLSTGLERALGVSPEGIRARKEVHEELHPYLAEGEKIAGLAGSLLIPVAGEARLAAGLGKAAEALIPAGAGIVRGAGKVAARFGAENALISTGDEVSKAFMSDPDQSVQTAMANIGLSGVIGGAIGAPFGAAKPAYQALKETAIGKAVGDLKDQFTSGGLGSFAQKVIHTVTGVTPENQAAYMARRDEILGTPELKEIHDHYLPGIEAVHEAVATKQLDSKIAESELKNIKKQMTDALTQQKYDAKQAAKIANDTFDVAETELAKKIHTGAQDVAPQIVSKVEQLHDEVVQGSADAYGLLDQSNKRINLGGFLNKGNELASNIRKEATPEALATADRLDQYLSNTVDQYGKDVAATDAKRLIQGLDKVSKYDFNASSFDKGLSRYYKQLRYDLDSDLKAAVPEYKTAMEPLAQKTQLLQKLSRYGEEYNAAKKINTLKNPTNFRYEMPLLKELEEITGGNFTRDIEQYANKDIRLKHLESLPEFKQKQQMARALKELETPARKRALESEIANTPEFMAHQASQKEFEQALLAKDALEGITPANLESKLKAAMKGKLNVEKAIANMPKYEGMDLADVLENLKVKEAFEGGKSQGSRKVNLFGATLGALAGTMGAALPGGAIGAIIGAGLDTEGHTVARKLLDFYMDHLKKLPEFSGVKNKEAIRLALAKTIDKEDNIKAASFIGTVYTIDQMIQGEKKLKKESNEVFSGEVKTEPSDKDHLKKLDDNVAKLQQAPGQMMNIGKDVGHYMPQASTSMAKASMSAVNYINQSRPQNKQLSPLDTPMKPSAGEMNAHYRKLEIAENPFSILRHIKKGTILPQDIEALNTIYPDLYKKMTGQLMASMTEHLADGGKIPYKVRQSLSLFMGQPLDSTMTPVAIQAIQGSFMMNKQQQMPQQGQPKQKGSTKELNKISKSMMTPGQAREAEELKG